MPHVIVKMYSGRSDADKKALAEGITRVIGETLGDGPNSISVAIEDVPPSQWMSRVYAPEIQQNAESLFKRPGYGPAA